jgi:hypothetical protein
VQIGTSTYMYNCKYATGSVARKGVSLLVEYRSSSCVVQPCILV